MVVNETRRRLLRQLNSRYIFGKYVCLRSSPIVVATLLETKMRARDVVEGHWRSKEKGKTSLLIK